MNTNGPALRAVLEKNPSALKQAAALDAERKATGPRGPLHGIPVLIKDNIATIASEGWSDLTSFSLITVTNAFIGMNTTAGSFSLLKSVVPEDATVVKKLREAGAIILGELTWERNCVY